MADSNRSTPAGPWESALEQVRDWDAGWAEPCAKMTTNPWTSDVLSHKFVELVGVALNSTCTNLNADGTRRHIRAANAAGATREGILFVLKCASVMSIHACSLGAPILAEELARHSTSDDVHSHPLAPHG